MSAVVEETDEQASIEDALESRHTHPSDLQYIGIAAFLAVCTAIEVAVYYLKADTLTIVVLLCLMVVKFFTVVMFFMHMRFESPVLKRLFFGGLTLAAIIYTIALFIFGIYHV